MVRTRSSSSSQDKDGDTAGEAMKHSPLDKLKEKVQEDVSSDEEPPKPVSSESSDGESDEEASPSKKSMKNNSKTDSDEKGNGNDDTNENSVHKKRNKTIDDKGDSKSEMSILFAPYRTIGIVTNGSPFYLIPHESSASAMICVPIGDRFHILGCDKLNPVLVSQKIPSINKTPQHISHLVSDATLSVTACAHGSESVPRCVTLYARTKPLATRTVAPAAGWKIVDLLHLGRTPVPMKGEKEGKMENAAIVAAIVAKGHDKDDDDNQHASDVLVVGDSDYEDSDSDDGSSTSSSSSSEEEQDSSASTCACQVVILLATRESLLLHKRIALTARPLFYPRVALHPSTFVNKIVVGGTEKGRASLLLVNIRSGKIVHGFSCLSHPKNHKGSITVTALEQSPAVDTIAVGTSQGKVSLINLRHDKTLFSVIHKSRDKSKGVRITSISFRTDGSALNYGIAPMAVGRADGNVTVWDLNPPEDYDENNGRSGGVSRTILCEMARVHSGGVSQLMYLPQEPLLVSLGSKSNAILMHVFDNPDHSGRILRQRKGHTAPPSRIRYLHPGAGAGGGVLVNAADGTDASACQILSSGGNDRTLRLFSTARTVLDKEYSQGKGLEKRAAKLGMDSTAELLFPPLTAMATAETRSRDWGDLVTIHKEHAIAYVWSTKRGAQSGPVLRQNSWNVSTMKVPPPRSAHAMSVAMSACGNFAVVGTRGGVIYKYNVQSGNPRGAYPRDATAEEESKKAPIAGDIKRTMKALEKSMKISNRASNLDKRDQDAVQDALVEQKQRAKLKLASHSGSAVTGIAVDSSNKTMISVGADAKLILWNFTTHAPHKKSPYALPSAATMLCHVRDSDLAAIALENYTTLLFDCTTLAIVRRFGASGTKRIRHLGPICDLAFSPDGRTLYTGSLDGTVRVWDVPTNKCVDWLGFSSPPTSLTVSPTGEFVATTHMGKLGISVWSDRSFYQTVNLDGARQLTEPFQMDEPRPIAEAWETRENALTPFESDHAAWTDNEETEDNEAVDSRKQAALPKESGLITLSDLPPAHWKNLFHLELVKERNKPKEPPKKPPSAPFFLQWRSSEKVDETPLATDANNNSNEQDEDEWKAAWSEDDEEGKAEIVDVTTTQASDDLQSEERAPANVTTSGNGAGQKRKLEHPQTESRFRTSSALGQSGKRIKRHRSHLATLLEKCYNMPAAVSSRRFQPVMDHIASLGPSAIDVSLSSLCSGMHDLEEGLPLLHTACLWLLEACESRERYEAVNAYLHRFLHLHGTVISGIEDSSWTYQKEASAEDHEASARIEEVRKELLQSLDGLRQAQRSALETLQGQIQYSMSLLRHFSRMV